MAQLKKKVKGSTAKVTTSKKQLELSLISVVDNIAFSRKERWAYYRLNIESFDYLSTEGKRQLGTRLYKAFAAIMGERTKPLDCHLIVATMPVDVEAWRQQNEMAVTWDTPEGFEDFIEMQYEYLRDQEYLQKAVYLGINIGRRGAVDVDSIGVLEGGFRAAVDTVKTYMSQLLQTPSGEITKAEEEYSQNRERELYQTISTGHLAAERCTAEEILLLIKRQMYPSMPVPYLDVDHENRLGPGDLALETVHTIRNKFRWLEITQIVGETEMTGYRACLTFSKFPKTSPYPDAFPFMYFLTRMNLPFPIYSRFSFHNVQDLKKEVAKKEKESKDELDNLSAGQDALDQAVKGTPPDVAEALADMQGINDLISSDKSPWVEGSYHVVVETPTEELLRKYCSILKQSYSDLDITVTWTSGDQAKLFLEQMPADRVRVDVLDQVTNIGQLAFSGANFSPVVGDRLKPIETKAN